MFEASGCAPPVIPVKAQKPSDKTKTENKEAQLGFNRAETIFLPSSDITSRVNCSPLEGHTAFGPWAASLVPSCTSRPLDAPYCTKGGGRGLRHARLQELIYSSCLTNFFPLLSSFVHGQSLFSHPHRPQGCASHFPLMVFGLTHHHCLPQSKLSLLGLESKVGRNYRN